ncbi:MAG: hypothetical protein ABJC89_13945 [Acidobacteriota bacterium]
MTQAPVGLAGCGRWGSLLLRDLRALGARVSVVARTGDSRMRAQTGPADENAARIVGALAVRRLAEIANCARTR